MTTRLTLFITIFALSLLTGAIAQNAPTPKGPLPGGKNGGPGGASQESAEMQALLKSFNLAPEQKAKYDAARAATSKQMRDISAGKAAGTLTQPEVLKQALASHKAFNAAVKDILTVEQYAKWEPLREADHYKIAQGHKERDAKRDAEKKAETKDGQKTEPQQ